MSPFRFCLLLFALVLSACTPTAATRVAELMTPTAVPHNPGVADILRHPPPPGATVEVDAYFNGTWGFPFSAGGPPPPDKVVCPFQWFPVLTDKPLRSFLQVLNSTIGNGPPEASAFFIAVDEEGKRPGVRTFPQLPFHARLRGHLGDPAFAQCESADRIFFVEKVVAVYAQEPPDPQFPMRLPADHRSWSRYHDAQFGFDVPYPPDWSVERLDEVTIALGTSKGQEYPLTIRVHSVETHYDQYNPSALPPLMRGTGGWSVFSQDYLFQEEKLDTQHLDGYTVEREARLGERAMAILISGGGHTYELTLRFPIGFEASQPLLTTLTAMVAGFHLDVLPGPSPTPPIKQTLGQGPFISKEEAISHLRIENAQDLTVFDAQLVTEAEARDKSEACRSTIEGHPDGIWWVTVSYVLEGIRRKAYLLIDAVSGEQYCGEEISADVTPFPVTLPPGAPMPAPTEAPAPTQPPAAPTQAPAPTQPPAAQVKLTVWGFGTEEELTVDGQKRGDWFRAEAKEFMQANPRWFGLGLVRPCSSRRIESPSVA